MSEYTPTTDEVLRCYRLPMSAEQGQRDGESFADFLSRRSIEAAQQQIADREAATRWLAEVERAAAENALLGLANHIEETAKRTDITFTEHVLARHGAVGMIHEYTAHMKKGRGHDD